MNWWEIHELDGYAGVCLASERPRTESEPHHDIPFSFKKPIELKDKGFVD